MQASARTGESEQSLTLTHYTALINRIEGSYPLPLGYEAMRDILSARGRALLGDDAEGYERCLAARKWRLERSELVRAALPPAACLADRFARDEMERSLVAMAEALLGELHGPNVLIFLDADGQIPQEASYSGPREVIAERLGNALVVRIPAMEYGASARLQELLAEPADAILLDLRGNEGGLLDEVIAIADMFMAQGKIIETEGRDRRNSLTYQADEAEMVPDIKLAVLIDEKSASGAEMIAAALQDSGRAVIIGAPSSGQSAIRTPLLLGRDVAVVLVTGAVYRPSGETIDGKGVQPHCLIDPSREDFLEQAVGVLAEEVVCTAP